MLHAVLVHLLRYDASNAAVPVGQRAVALLKTSIPSSPQPVHVLVAYEPSTQRQDVMVALTEAFTLTVSPSYASFYDDGRHYWALNAAADQLELFAKHVAMAKNAQMVQSTAQPVLVSQDLAVGAGERGVAVGDHVKVKYSMYTASATHPKGFGALVGHVGSDEKPKQIKAGGRRELAGIEAGLLGMRKGGRRFLVIPPHLAYGAQQAGTIPPNSTLLVELTCVKVKHAEGSAPAPTPNPIPAPSPPVHAPPAVAALPLPAPGGAPMASPSASDEEEDAQRSHLAKKMAHMGFKMPGLPGSMDPEHLGVVRAGESRRASVDSREGSGEGNEPPSPALSSVSVSGSAPALHLPPVLPSTQPQPHPQHALPTPGLPQHPQQQQQQQQQPSPHYQPQQQQQAPASYYTQPSPPLPQQHASQSGHPYGYSPQYSYLQDSHYASTSSPAHISPSHTPHPYGYPGPPPGHSHSSSLSHTGPFGSSAASGAALSAIDAKLDSLLSSFAQQSRILGTANPSLLYESPLSGAQLIRAMQALLSERDEWKAKADERERRVVELQAKTAALQERHEKYSEDNSRLMERRYEQHADELKAKTAQLMDLQHALRKAEHDAQQAHVARQEADSRTAKLEDDLARAREEGRMRSEFERQVGLLQVQLRQANEAVEGKEQEGRLAMEQRVAAKESEIAQLQRDAEHAKDEAARERAALQATIDNLKAQLDHAQQTADERIQRLSAAVAAAEDERTRMQGEVERTQAALQRLQESSVAQSVHQTLQDETAETASRLREAQREVEEARAETASIIDQARARREQDRQQLTALLEQARTEEYERGQAETMEEARAGMQAMKEKARATIDALAAEKDALEERLREAEQEKDDVLATSRAYIDKMKAQMAARLAEADGQRDAQDADEAKEAALKAVYSGVSRALQAKGERRWRAQEVAMLIRAEVQFVLTGERPDVELHDEPPAVAEAAEHAKQPPTEEKKAESPVIERALPEQREEVPEEVKEPAPVGQEEVDIAPPAMLRQDTEVEDLPPASPPPEVEHREKPAEGAHTSVVEMEPEPAAAPHADVDKAPVDQNGHPADSASAAAADRSPSQPPEQQTAVDAPLAPHAAEPAEPALSLSMNPSETNGVDVTGTFLYPHDGPAVPGASAPSVEERAGESEAEDHLAPLRPSNGTGLTVDPSAERPSSSSSSTITPPTPTLMTPPASQHARGFSPPSSTSSTPTAAPAISDPFADPFAEAVPEQPAKATPTAVASRSSDSPAAPATAKRSSLFSDDDDEDGGGLFAAPAKPVAAPKTTASPAKKASLFGDDSDDEDDGGLFKT